MTTIAYKDGVIAYDSRAVQGDGFIMSDNFNKKVTHKDTYYFIAGRPDHTNDIIKAFNKEEFEHNSSGGLVVSNDLLYYVCFDSTDKFSCISVPLTQTHATGSGMYHAITAMDMGATAKEAVKMAIKRDTYTGGRIRTFNIPGYTSYED